MHRATLWLATVKRALPEPLQVNWRYFSLYQINHPDKEHWRIWEQPVLEDPGARYSQSLRCFWAAEAARRQGEDAFQRFHVALLAALHEDKKTVVTLDAVSEVARQVGLDMDRFRQDATDRSCLDRLAADHTEGITVYGVFGTPTFVFPGAEPVYLKLRTVPTPTDALEFWDMFRRTAVDLPFVLEFKRPQ